MESASVYIPIDRRIALAEGRELAEHTHGAALFADISGFTPLTEMLAKVLGPKRGAEELTIYLNRVYDALIAELYRFGGSVIGFSGDAITCWFDGGTQGQAGTDAGLSTLRATASALAMQNAMAQFVNIQITGGGQVSLGMKAAVATGPVRRFIVGDPQYTLLDVMAGKTLENLANTEHQANKGDIILDAISAEIIGGQLQISEWRTDEHTNERYAVVSALHTDISQLENPWRVLASDTFTNEQLKSWLLPSVYRLLAAGQADFLAELRSAAALFLHFGGIDYDRDEDAPQKLDDFMRQVQKILARYDGSLLQLTVGDKGSYLYAAFGAPIAHEDDVDRMASAALQLQELPKQLDFLEPLQIGLTFGRMRVGAYGSVASRTYGVLGDAVNLSARLMQASQPGQILANEDVYNRASLAFEWEDLPPIKVKGKSEPIAVYRLVQVKHRRVGAIFESRYPLPPVGRETILAGLEAGLEKLTSSQGQIICLAGEAGMGKSHVAAHFIRRAETKKIKTAVGICQSITQNSAYRPWRHIFLSLLDLQNTTENEAVEKLTNILPKEHESWAVRLPLLGDLLGLPIPDNPTTAAMDSTLRQATLFSLLVEMLQAWATEQPLLLLVDNAHWMDEASRELTKILAQQVCSTVPALVFLVMRPSQKEEEPIFSDLVSLSNYNEFTLTEMNETEIAALVQRALDSRPSVLLLQILQQTSRGNPFYVNELLSAMQSGDQVVRTDSGEWQASNELIELLQQANVIVQADGQQRLRPDAYFSKIKMGIPDSIHGLILSRLDRLPETHKMTLKVSSVIGYMIDLELLALSHPENKPKTEIESEASFMESKDVMQREISAEKLYTFMHHTTQEVAYDTLLFTQRQQLHRAVAEALVQYQPDAIAQVAYHAYAGELWPVALQYNLTAGNQARQLHSTRQGIDFFQKALKSAERLSDIDTTKERAQIHLSLGELYLATGQHDEAIKNLQTALTLAQTQNDRESEARVCRWYGRVYEHQGEYTQALSWLDKGFTALNGFTSLEEAEISLIAGLINVRQGNYARALELCERSLQVGIALNDIAVQARTHNLLGIIDLRSSGANANEKFQRSLRQYEEIGNLYGQATCHNLIANGHFAKGELSLADLHYRQSLDLFIQIGHIYSQVLVNNNLGGIAVRRGNLDAALGYYQQAKRQLQQIHGSLWVLAWLHVNIGNTLIQRGELAQATDELQHAFGYYEQTKARDILPELYGLFAELYLRKNDLDIAEREIYRSIEVARELKMPREEGHSRRILGEIAMARQQLDQAQEILDESYNVLDQTGDEYEIARTQLVMAQLHRAQGNYTKAANLLDQCTTTFERLQASLDLLAVQSIRGTFPE